MILKSLLIKYVVRYSVKDKKQEHNKEEATIVLRHHLRSGSIEGVIKEFARNETFRLYKREDSVVLFHDIISFAPSDKNTLTTEILKSVAKKYIELRAPNCLSLVVAHRGKTSHSHLHAVVAGVKLDGKSARISKARFKQIKLEMEKFQEQYPQLHQSAIEHVKPLQQVQTKRVERFKQTRQTNKETIYNILEAAYAKAISEEDFLQQLKAKQYEPYYRHNKLQGLVSVGQKYRFSRLGFDTGKLESFKTRPIETENRLQEIKELRKKKSLALALEIDTKNEESVKEQNTTEEGILTEISALRRRSIQKELTGHSLDLTH
jgi:hypothetical protein